MRLPHHLTVLTLAHTLLLVTAGLATAADEPDELMVGRVVFLKTGTIKRIIAKPIPDLAFDMPDVPANDPRTQGGTLHVFDTEDPGQDDTYDLPAGLAWKGLGNPPGSRGFKYRGAGTLADPCVLVLVRSTAVKMICRGPAIVVNPPFSGEVAVVLTIGTASKRYCASFGGDERENRPGYLVRKSAPFPSACLTPPKLCTPVLKWGTAGSGNGQFNTPSGVATDGSGNVYVADTYNHRIQKFDPSGTFLTTWGTAGGGDGQFTSPYDVATDALGNVYVADSGNDRVQKFDGSGTFLAKWGTSGSGDGQFFGLSGVATDGSGNVYVADGNNRVQKFDGSGAFLTKWGTMGSGDGEFSDFSGLETDGSGNVYTAELPDNHRIQKFDGSGTFITKWGTSGSGDGQFVPSAVATDGSGNVYVADGENGRIQKFDGSGNFITKWGTVGSGDGQFVSPSGVATDASGNVYVADAYNNRIQKFSGCP